MYKLREEYQLPAHNATVEHCRKTHEPAFHNITVGGGKSILIAFITKHVADKGGRVLNLARQGELVEQNVEDYRSVGGKASVFSASLGFRSTYYPVIFGTEGTIGRALDDEFKALSFNLLVIDESHMVKWQDALDDMPETQYGRIISHLLSINPQMRIIGYTGSPYRDNESIKGEFWKEQLSDVSTYQLISMGYLVPPVFGFGDDDHHYQGLEKFEPSTQESANDFSAKELQSMGREICKQKDMTQLIMEDVIDRTQGRLCVLITCASKKHCEQVAECLPDGSWGIVTDSTSTKKRREILSGAKNGSLKYLIQIGCLSTGINIPRIDCIVILRKIGSLVYLIQLTGRGLRTLKPEQVEQGLQKDNCLILDFSDTFERMGKFFDDPIIQEAVVAKKSKEVELIECPICNTQNSEYAVRCRGESQSSSDGRCEHFFKATTCLKCGTDNAPTAKQCRNCHAILIDPNDALINKAYSDADYKKVLSMDIEPTKSNDGLCITYHLASMYHKDGKEYPEKAKEYFKPFDVQQFNKAKWYKFIKDHIQGDRFRRMFASSRDINELIQKKAMLDKPVEITHRVNSKGFSLINRKKFSSGREETAS